MRKFLISTDTTADLPADFCRENSIDIHPLFYRFDDDKVYGGTSSLPNDVFYQRMRDGEMPTTMATNPEDSKNIFEKRILAGYDIIHIAFSSALSSSCQNTIIAAQELAEQYPECRITVIDSLAASLGEGLLVYYAVQYMKDGHSYDEVVQYVEDLKLHVSHQFTVDNLFHLQRGGRISRAAAILGTIISIKPLLHVDDLGRLIPIGKVRGRKKSLVALVDAMVESMGNYDNSTVMISHGDCLADAEYVASLVKERTNAQNIVINYVCPTIGSHSGPGTVALFFLADHR